MRRESLLPFLPAALAAVTAGVAAAIVRANQPDYPDSVIVFQIAMFGRHCARQSQRNGYGSQVWCYFWPRCSSQVFGGVSLSPDHLCCRVDNSAR